MSGKYIMALGNKFRRAPKAVLSDPKCSGFSLSRLLQTSPRNSTTPPFPLHFSTLALPYPSLLLPNQITQPKNNFSALFALAHFTNSLIRGIFFQGNLFMGFSQSRRLRSSSCWIPHIISLGPQARVLQIVEFGLLALNFTGKALGSTRVLILVGMAGNVFA